MDILASSFLPGCNAADINALIGAHQRLRAVSYWTNITLSWDIYCLTTLPTKAFFP